MRRYRYSRWDPDKEPPCSDPEALMDALGQELTASGDLAGSLDRLQPECPGQTPENPSDGPDSGGPGGGGDGKPDHPPDHGAWGGPDRPATIPHVLEQAGYIRTASGKYELTARGMRRIGQKALADIFARIRKGRLGGHAIGSRGVGGPIMDETRPYEPGDDFQIHLQKTIMNTVRRAPLQWPLPLEVRDFEVFQREGLKQSATVLMLDLSFSMKARGHFEAAKKVALALDGLIRSQYPRDRLSIVGFSDHARQIQKQDLAYVQWGESDHYTNLQHGLYLAGKLLSKERSADRQIILVTDGEPTAHFEDKTRLFTQAPADPRTLEATFQEVRACTRKGIVINTFMLENNAALTAFVTRMARINRGRVFFTRADTLGQYLIVDYLAHRKRVIAS